MLASTSSSLTMNFASQPDVVADRVRRRAELGKMARRLQNRLALAQFKTRHGWEDLTLDMIEPKVEDEIRRKRASDGDVLSDSSSSTSELPYPAGRTLMSSPLKASLFSDAINSSNGSTGHRKRTFAASFDDLHHNLPYDYPHHPHQNNRHASFVMSSPSKRFRSSPPPSNKRSLELAASGPAGGGGGRSSASFAQRSYLPPPPPPPQQQQSTAFSGHAAWKDHHQLSHSSPIKPRRQQHFTTAAGPDVSLFPGARRIADALTSVNYNAPPSDDDDELLPTHSFQASSISLGPPAPGLSSTARGGSHATRSGSPPSTPPMRMRGLPNHGHGRRKKKTAGGAARDDAEHSHGGFGLDNHDDDDFGENGGGEGGGGGGKSGVEGADLLLYLAASPSPANPASRSRMEPPSTPPSKYNSLALPSSMMTTPGGGSMFPNTPGQAFDFSEFVNITPSPAQKPWKTPNLLGSRTPMSVTRRRLTFDDPL
ncbi:nrm1-like protein [Niveomyces insectorum RCEF 264]|uniref:Nrm1-like protein n=1 Tax=Niveomyces insectorum RCEF 264 TaxID=1081102 RepID=A0A167X8C3_9HYPO|nr:nrm1-like protein [Niveomyces insectorum RCEF 264]